MEHWQKGLRSLLHNQQYFMSLIEFLDMEELMADMANMLDYK